MTIVIPVFNREWCIDRALSSAFRFLKRVGGGEVVIADDGSTDGSVRKVKEFLANNRCEEVQARVIEMPRNSGVCAAKNTGALGATGEWLMFLDSDDEVIDSAAPALVDVLAAQQATPLHFFRCIDEHGMPVGAELDGPVTRNFDEFIVEGTSGESLPVVLRETFVRFRYDEDINGFEGLCYARIVRVAGCAVIHPLRARKYYTSHDDRLSSSAGVRRRARCLARGYWRLLTEHFGAMNFHSFVFVCSRAIYHRVRSLIQWRAPDKSGNSCSCAE